MIVRSVLLLQMAIVSGCTSRVVVFPSDSMNPATFDRQLESQFQYGPPQPPPKEFADPRAGRSADASYFRQFPAYDRSYSLAARARAVELADRLSHEASALSHEQFVLRVAEIAALADNAHTAIDQNALMKNTPRVLLRTYLFSDGLFVVRAGKAFAHLLGARIDRIDGLPTPAMFQALSRYAGGTKPRRDRQLLPVLESPALLEAAGLTADAHSVTYAGILSSGQRFTERVAAEKRNAAAPVQNSARLLFPAPADAPMASLIREDGRQPLYLTNGSRLFWMDSLPGNGLYVCVTFNNDSDELTLESFLASVLDRVKREQPRFVVIDMRMNGGGDYTKSYAFARALPAASKARIYALTSPFTFSAAITTVAALKDAGGARVKIVGESVGDRLSFWAEGGSFVLPNGNVTAYFAAGRHTYDGPCNDPATCFWLNRRYPVRVKTLSPDYPAPLSFVAYRAGRDPGLERILVLERAIEIAHG